MNDNSLASASENPDLLCLRFPDEKKSLNDLTDRFNRHLNIIRDKLFYLTGKNCLDAYSIDLKIVDSFCDISFNISFNQYILNQLFGAISNHEAYRPTEMRDYYLKSIQEADDIAKSCISIMHQIKSWIPKDI